MSKDFILNLMASFITTAALQLIIYPKLKIQLDSVIYGIVLTIIGLANTFAATIGSSLNNTRLLLNESYDDSGYKGDYLPILLASNFISAIILFVLLQKFEVDLMTKIILVVYMVANSTRTYGAVAYRIIINYTKNLICNILVAVGDLLGLFVLFMTNSTKTAWPICFLTGELFAIIYIFCSSEIYAEGFKKTPFFVRTVKKDIVLMITGLTANILLYLDRIFLLPILGGEAVTIYTVASIFGKSIGILMTPLAGVLLSYFSQKEFRMDKKGFRVFNLVNICVAVVFMIVSHFISGWFTGLLYPDVIADAKAYLDIANAAAIVTVLGNMTLPTVLRYAPSYWLLIIQLSYLVTYLSGGILVVGKYGLLGFSYVSVATACLKVLMQLWAGRMYVGDKKQ
ncbi:MAG: hypothetical protein J5802_14845 [Butyrivibrio sp.]|nr:hypothetical protein [Butyrivibrio sp.]